MRLMMIKTTGPSHDNNLDRTLTLVEDNSRGYVVDCYLHCQGSGGCYTRQFLEEHAVELKRKED